MSQQAWIKLDEATLRKIELGDLPDDLWIAVAGYRTATIARYVWQQGQNPHGFNTIGGSRFDAKDVTHVMPFVPPALPTE